MENTGRNVKGLQNQIRAVKARLWSPRSQNGLPITLGLLCLCLVFGLSGCALTGSNNLQGHSASLSITTANLSNTQPQTRYQAGLSASGGSTPYLWTISSGNLPSGLSLTNATGEISGMTTQEGSFSFTVQVQDSSSPLKSATHDFMITVSKPRSGSGVSITTTSMPNGTVGTAYGMTFGASGGTSPYAWKVSAGSLPAGLSLNSSTGVVSGTPSQSGTSNPTIEVTDATNSTAQSAFSIVVSKGSSSSGSSLSVTTRIVPAGTVGVAYATSFSATGGSSPYTWRVISGSLPSGLSLSTSSGALTGTPSQQQTANFAIAVTDSTQQSAQAAFSLAIAAQGSNPTSNPNLDQFGGRLDKPCAQVTPYFHTEKIGNRWYFCDADGNAFISMSVGSVVTNSNPTKDCNGVNTFPIYLAKYGDTSSNWGWQTLKRLTSWGFNSIGQDSGGPVLPWETCSKCVWPGGKQPIPVPYISEPKPAEAAATNRNGFIASPIKDEISATNSNYSAWRGGALFDVFDPGLDTEWTKELQSTQQSNQQTLNNSPYLLAILTDDSDFFIGSGAGPDFSSPGHTNANMGWVTLISSPVETYIQATTQTGASLLYTIPKNYSKTLAANPTTTCSIADPCSLRDYLSQKYNGSIGSLNAAWGSNYTTFDSTGTQVTGETIATADGSTSTFNFSIPAGHEPVSPYSVAISVGGTMQMGDCPWFHAGCSTSTPNTGTLGSPTANLVNQASSTINYSTGAITIHFVTAPAKGTAITANYIYNGWMAGGTGLMDEDGSHTSWVGTNAFCLEGPDPNYPTFFSCSGPGGNGKPNANAALGADLDNWVAQIAAQYFKTMQKDLRAVSKVPYFGLDTVGSWGVPAYSKFLEGEAPYVDGAFVTMSLWQQSQAEFSSIYQYTTQYFGDKPLITFNILSAQADSSMSCYANPGNPKSDFPSQSARGAGWNSNIQYLLTTPGHSGTYPVVGFDWWSWQDFQQYNQGLVSIHDNAYDGHEDVPGKIACSLTQLALTCGGENSSYGDAISQIKVGNLFWLTQ